MVLFFGFFGTFPLTNFVLSQFWHISALIVFGTLMVVINRVGKLIGDDTRRARFFRSHYSHS